MSVLPVRPHVRTGAIVTGQWWRRGSHTAFTGGVREYPRSAVRWSEESTRPVLLRGWGGGDPEGIFDSDPHTVCGVSVSQIRVGCRPERIRQRPNGVGEFGTGVVEVLFDCRSSDPFLGPWRITVRNAVHTLRRRPLNRDDDRVTCYCRTAGQRHGSRTGGGRKRTVFHLIVCTCGFLPWLFVVTRFRDGTLTVGESTAPSSAVAISAATRPGTYSRSPPSGPSFSHIFPRTPQHVGRTDRASQPAGRPPTSNCRQCFRSIATTAPRITGGDGGHVVSTVTRPWRTRTRPSGRYD